MTDDNLELKSELYQKTSHHQYSICSILMIFACVQLQICIVLYLLGWYEADGLRCQLCLFHPQHCEDEHPFRLANSATWP